MRVISGKYKGSILEGDKIDGTRPTIARVKESVFATIQNKIPDSIVLDLFAGSGSLGIEALSMGAKFCYFIDHQKQAFNALTRNTSKLKISKDVKIIKSDFISFLKQTEVKFDIIFLDPPYDSDYIKRSVDLIVSRDLLKKDGIIVCETSSLDRVPECDRLEVLKNKKYGDKFIVILEKI